MFRYLLAPRPPSQRQAIPALPLSQIQGSGKQTPRNVTSAPPSARGIETAGARLKQYVGAKEVFKASAAGGDFFEALKVLREFERKKVHHSSSRTCRK